MINPQWLELPMSRIYFHVSLDVRVTEVLLYLENICMWSQKKAENGKIPGSATIRENSLLRYIYHSTIPVRRVPSCQVPRFPFLHHIFQSVQKSPCVEKTTLQLLPGFCNKANTDNRISGACLYISKYWDCQESVQVVTSVATDYRL